MSIIGETEEVVDAHPYLILGLLGGLVALWYFWPSSSGSTAPGQFTFSYGPSDANIAAGTQLAIQQAQDQTATSIATLNAQTGTQNLQDYLGYLTTNSANQTTVAQQQISAQQGVDSQQIAAQVTGAQYQAATNQQAIAAQTTQAGYSATTATNIAAIQAQAQVQIAQQQAAAQAAAAQAASNAAIAQANAQAAAAAAAAQANLVNTNPNAALVSADYQSIFGRAPDAAGQAYWVQQLSTGAMSAANLAKALVSGAQGSDVQAAAARGYG